MIKKLLYLLLPLSPFVQAGDVATLNLKTFSNPPPGYSCALTDLSTRKQNFGSHIKSQGCRVTLTQKEFTPLYTVCWLSGISHTPNKNESGGHSCRVQTVGGIWEYSASTSSGVVDCTFMCIRKPR